MSVRSQCIALLIGCVFMGSAYAQNHVCEKHAPAQLNLMQAMERALQCGPEFQNFRWQYEAFANYATRHRSED